MLFVFGVPLMQFPSMSSLQGALPSVPPSSGLMHPSSLANPSLAWNSPQSSLYGSAMPPQSQVQASAMAPSIFITSHFPSSVTCFMPKPFLFCCGSWTVLWKSQGHSWGNKCQLLCQCQGNYTVAMIIFTFQMGCFKLGCSFALGSSSFGYNHSSTFPIYNSHSLAYPIW